jgi:predicted XRE-type DNA-binding protein
VSKAKKKSKKIPIEIGSGNVFADLGMANPEERLTKALLATQIADLIAENGLNQQQAAERLGIDQPKVSSILNGRLRGFSTDRLMAFLNALDRDVIITIQPVQKNHPASVKVLARA